MTGDGEESVVVKSYQAGSALYMCDCVVVWPSLAWLAVTLIVTCAI